MNANQARRRPAKRGCTFEPGKGGHPIVRRGDREPVLPMHGGRKDLGKGLRLASLRDLGPDEE